MQWIRRTADRSRTGRPRSLLTLVALFALLLQAFEVQTHVHAYGVAPAPVAGASSVAHHQANEPHASLPHPQLLCVVCQALAAAGGAVVPAGGTLTTAVAIAREAAAIVAPDAPRVLAHAWQSRAPPASSLS